MLKPKVGDIVLMSSPQNLLTTVVLPALSRPLQLDSQGNITCAYKTKSHINSIIELKITLIKETKICDKLYMHIRERRQFLNKYLVVIKDTALAGGSHAPFASTS